MDDNVFAIVPKLLLGVTSLTTGWPSVYFVQRLQTGWLKTWSLTSAPLALEVLMTRLTPYLTFLTGNLMAWR